MKGVLRLALVLVCLVVGSGLVVAQERPAAYILSTYYVCDSNREDWADTIFEHFLAPVYDRHVQAGKLLGYGYLGHHAGGEWRRAFYMAGSDLNGLLDTRDSIMEEFQKELAAAGREITGICPDHDDYIWSALAGSTTEGGQLRTRPAAAYSTYLSCDPARLTRADQIVREAFTPILNRLQREGKLFSWSWMGHVLGGDYRRLISYMGSDHKTLLAAMEEYQSSMDAGLGEEFRSICGSHEDYLWNTILAKP